MAKPEPDERLLFRAAELAVEYLSCAPSAMVAEEAVCEWVLDLLGLPRDAGVGAARYRKLTETGWDVEGDGLFGPRQVRVILGAHAHTTVRAALRMLGFGGNRVEVVQADGVEILNEVVLNQVLVRFTRDGVNVSDEVLQAAHRRAPAG